MAKNVPLTLDKVKAFGFVEVEASGDTYGVPPDKFKEMLASRGLQPISAHFAFEKLRDDPEGVARDAKALGLKYVGCAWIPHKDPFDEKTCRQTAAIFNHAGEVLAANGIRFFYHTHGYEFQPYADGTLFDLLVRETKPALVGFQMDVFWVVHPGQDPVKLLQKYGNRWELMHLKDMKNGLKTGDLSGHTDVANDVALGTGQMDWPAILLAAQKAGVKHYFIEDESPNVSEQIPVTLKYLEQVRF
jgi:sugar phosphate isomerase/epimerase